MGRVRASWVGLVLLYAAALVFATDDSIFQVVVPDVRRSFGLSLAAVGALSSAATLAEFIQLVTSYLADRSLPRKGIFVAQILLLAIGTAAAGVSGYVGSLPLLFASRVGVGASHSSNPTALSLLSDYHPPSRRTASIYGLHLPAVAGGLIGPVAAGFLAVRFGWQSPFLLLSVPAFLITGLIAAWLQEPRRGQFDAGEETTRPAPDLRGSVALVWSRPTVRWFYVVIALVSAVGLSTRTFSPVLFRDAFHVDASALGVVVGASAALQFVLLVISGVAITRAMATRPRRAAHVLAGLLACAGLAVLALALASKVAVAIAAFVAVQALIACGQAGILAVAANAVPPAVRTFAFGLTSLTFVLVAPFAPLLGVLGDRFGFRAPLLGTIPIVLAGIAAFAAMSRTIERDMTWNIPRRQHPSSSSAPVRPA